MKRAQIAKLPWQYLRFIMLAVLGMFAILSLKNGQAGVSSQSAMFPPDNLKFLSA